MSENKVAANQQRFTIIIRCYKACSKPPYVQPGGRDMFVFAFPQRSFGSNSCGVFNQADPFFTPRVTSCFWYVLAFHCSMPSGVPLFNADRFFFPLLRLLCGLMGMVQLKATGASIQMACCSEHCHHEYPPNELHSCGNEALKNSYIVQSHKGSDME